eukprot:Tbor_TRINITY_DN5318_c0_g6::TRINITY_DN5318_c0_g6_i1::g.4696::m.4696
MRIPVYQHRELEVALLEKRRRCSVIELLDIMRRKSIAPTTEEWLMIQDCLDDVCFRMGDLYSLIAFSVSVPYTRGVTRWPLRLLAACYGYEAGLRSTSLTPTISLWNTLVLIDSPVGEVARSIHAPRIPLPPISTKSSQLLLSSEFFSPPSPFESSVNWLHNSSLGAFAHFAFTSVSFLCMYHTISTLLGGSAIMDHKRPVYMFDYIHLSITTRYLRWRPIHWYNRKEVGFTEQEQVTTLDLDFPVFDSPLSNVESKGLVRVKEVILANTHGFAHIWWKTHLSVLQYLVSEKPLPIGE